MKTITVLQIMCLFLTHWIFLIESHDNNCATSESSVLLCTSERVPVTIPDNVSHVILDGVNLDYFHEGQFSDLSWNQITQLDIIAPRGNYLNSGTFHGLDNLNQLSLRGEELHYTERESFRGLPQVEKLDLSDNIYLDLNHVLITLQDDVTKTLPSLKWLKLARIYSYYTTTIQLSTTNDAFGILSRRKIEYLDLSGCNISPFDLNEMEKMCNSLRHLILKDSSITNPLLLTQYSCESLRELDLGYSRSIDLYDSLLFLQFANEEILKESLCVFMNVETVYLSHWSLGQAKDIQLTLPMPNIPMHFKKIDLSHDNIQKFNISVALHPVTAQSVSELDFSNNQMIYMSPGSLVVSYNLKNLNLSHNSLNKMAMHHHHDFRVLLRNLTLLSVIDLSSNGLQDLPQNFFADNQQLTEINMSMNVLQKIDFKINHLTKLRILDLRGNKIKLLDATVVGQFRFIHESRNTYLYRENKTTRIQQNTNPPTVVLQENPLECLCDEESINSLKWLLQSGNVVPQTTLTCTFNGKNIAIGLSTIEQVVKSCHEARLLKTLWICALVLSLVLVVCAIVIFFVRRLIKKRHHLKNFIKMVQANDKLKYLIFLSFCCEDGDLVLEHIYPRMKDEASQAMGCDRNLICCGELNFRPGMSVCLEVMRCMEESAVVIFVVSKTFCEKSWCRMEVDTANSQRKPVILLFLEKMDPESMTPYIHKLFDRYSRATWINGENGGDLHPPWPVLISSVIELGSAFYADNKNENEDAKEELE